MKLLNRNLVAGAIAVSATIAGLLLPATAFAIVPAVAPSLGTASSFSVFAGSAMTADGSGATISGDLGVNPGLSVSGPWTVGGHRYFGTGGLSGTAKTDATAAWTTMGSSGGTAWNPATVGATLTTGLYTRDGDAIFASGNTLTLSGSASDVWIFQINSSLTFSGTIAFIGGASACNVFWRIASSATINSDGVGSQFAGTLIANSNVSLVSGPTVVGRMMALTGTLSTAGATTISGCAIPAVVPGPHAATITVVKNVINDNGGKKVSGDFSLFVNERAVASGMANTFPVPASYVVTETPDPGYTASFSGDCDATGHLSLAAGEYKVCVITNNDIGAPVVPPVPPLIDIVKVPSPLALPNGPGPVNYTYTVRNVGTVPMTNVTLVGDTCSPIVRQSGDTNNDNKLDVSETWVYTCSTNLTETHTNTVVATGWANGISATHIASATVVVGASLIPPLIHVTKIPSPLALSAGGGTVTYTETVTNPGTVALNNVTLSDDKCSPMKYVSGDTNGNSMLESSESWVYTCQSKLTKTTSNTAVASGIANGFSVRDFAVATVIVAAPGLPNTGFPPLSSSTSGQAALVVGILLVILIAFVISRRRAS